MRTVLFLLQKEFIQVLRNKTMLPIIFLLPVVQLVILVHAANQEMKRINVCFVDGDHSAQSRALMQQISAAPFYHVKAYDLSVSQGEELLTKGDVDLVLVLPCGFEKNLLRTGDGNVQLLINAINGTTASLIMGYTQGIVADFNRNIASEWLNLIEPGVRKQIQVMERFWYNPELDYKIYMLPGILVILVTVVGMFLTALNLVREKELGTIEQINVTPIKKYQFLAGKLIPFWLIAILELGIGLAIGRLFFNVPMLGPVWLLFIFAAVYLLVALGFGLLLSTITDSQQQVMFLAWFFVMVFLLMSGLFTAVESMPAWAQKANLFNPMAYFIRVIRMVMLKGSGFHDIAMEFYTLLVYGTVVLGLAVWKYSKVS